MTGRLLGEEMFTVKTCFSRHAVLQDFIRDGAANVKDALRIKGNAVRVRRGSPLPAGTKASMKLPVTPS